jgi:hypothetical protein
VVTRGCICGVVWCGVVWCGVVWCGVVWCGVVWCGVVWCGVGTVTVQDSDGDRLAIVSDADFRAAVDTKGTVRLDAWCFESNAAVPASRGGFEVQQH